ncbi:hypothetical protein J2Y69_000513 [Microbacterium resistens]|uniref:ABC3 transporter permease C-terminal domain-containing protein n=1 Tax=Microbacterium resistens TaxID=156977 RepID=A0ABU1SAI6_9MICO|nr:FtsX-like permease family protein [Microbacterium resistens]MDR6865928.1 hypothetical protein [Microbacterium resistens]
MTFAMRRGAVQAGRLVLVALLCAIAVMGIGGVDAMAGRLIDDGVREVYREAEPSARTVSVVAARAPDDEDQERSVLAAIDEAFGGADVDIARQVTNEISAGNPDAVRLLSDDRIPELARLTEGRWPERPGEVAVPEAAATIRGWRIDGSVPLGTGATPATVVGVWAPLDPADPAWNGDPGAASGETDGAAGPVVVSAAGMAELRSTPTVTWTVTPRTVAADDLPVLRDALVSLAALPEAVDPQNQRSTRIAGGLAETVDRAARAVQGTRGLLVVPIVFIGTLGVIALGVVLGSLVTARREELFLLSSRGASPVRLAGHAAVESAVAAAAGTAIAFTVLLLSTGIGSAALLAGAGAVVIAAGIAGIATRRASTTGERRRGDAGRRATAALLLPFLLLVIAAAFSVWQLRATGSFIRPDGTADPLAASAPALTLIAACALAPLLVGPLAAGGERLARRGRGIIPVLPLRQIARRVGSATTAVLCLALAAGVASLAAAAPGITAAVEREQLRGALGADVRVVYAGTSGERIDPARAAALAGASGASEAVHRPLAIGSENVDLVAAAPDALGLDEHGRRALEAPVEDGEVAAVVTSALADRLGARAGTVATALLRTSSLTLSIRVVDIVPALPGIGTAPGVAVSDEALAALAGKKLPADELWIRTASPAQTADAVRGVLKTPARVLTPGAVSTLPITGTAGLLLWAGAGAAALLAVLGFAAAVTEASARRRSEAIPLRSLGMDRARQRSARVAEIVTIAVLAVVIGTVAGLAVAPLVLPPLLGAST